MRFASQSWMLKVDRRFSVMHIMKGGLAGSACTQARHYESGQKKIRRLSKEKRKEMVESFIKKYQGLNNGNFPSLNLTHKEVGGSFYTIREIVRDIIQENRVLGSAKSLEGEQDSVHSFKQFPLGTISTEPEEHSSPIGSYQHEESSEELFLISDKSYAQPDQSQINVGSHITNGIKAATDRVTEQLKTSKNMEEVPVSRTKVTEMGPITQTTEKSDGNFVEARDLKGSLVEKDVEKPIEPGIDTASSDGPTSEELFSVSDKLSSQPGQSHNTGSHIANDIKAANDVVTMKIMEEVPVSRSKVTEIADVTVETFPFPTITQATEKSDGNSIEVKDLKGLSHGSALLDGLEVEFVESKQDRLLYGKAVNATTDLPSGNSNSCITENDVRNHTRVDKDGYLMSSSSDKAVAETKVADVTEQVIVESSGTSEKKSKPTLDRINLESWEVESKAPKTNPVVATLKSIIAAFTKFWS